MSALLIPMVAFSVTARGVMAQGGSEKPEPPPGFPVTSDVVIRNCSACHTRDSTGRMSRISYLRKNPEGWQTSVRRMVALNGVPLDATTAREVVRYLADHQGLAPEEADPGRFEVERRSDDWSYKGDKDTEETCKACHSLGRVILQRRTKEEWELLVATHRALYPIVDYQGFRRFGPPPDTGDGRHPMEKAIAHLAVAFPLETPEWRAWSATMRSPRLDGTWLLTGYEPGAGPVHGRVTITADPKAPDEFTSEATYTYARDGRRVTRGGRAIVYTGFQWRGRSTVGGSESSGLREVMTVDRDWKQLGGRWFTGPHDELGLDVTLTRMGRDVEITGAGPEALTTGGGEQELRLYGANFPPSPTASAFDLGPGVTVTGVGNATPDMVTLKVRVDSAAKIGRRDVYAAGAHRRNAFVVYDKVQRIAVTPLAGMARVGGTQQPKQVQQFEVTAFNDGPDGKPNTADDLALGTVPVVWSLEEYTVTFDDDDLKYVGTLDQKGLFTPAVDGPNPARHGNRNNVGDVWVVASYTPPSGTALRARAHLLVTVPLYMRWDPGQDPGEADTMTQLALAEFHPFEAAGRRYLYLVPSAAVFGLDEASGAVLDTLAESPRSASEVATALSGRFAEAVVQQTIVELAGARAIRSVAAPAPAPAVRKPGRRIPLQTIVLNVTSKCNLACTYCYEYGEDKIKEAAANPLPRFMSEETARQSVDFAFGEAGESKHVHVTFFGGETLLNAKVLRSTVTYARERAVALGKTVDFSLTTNATLITEEIIDWLVENDVGVTVSIDGPKQSQDRFRVFHNGKGSYEVVLPRIKALLARHNRRPVGARVTLTKQNLEVVEIYRHLVDEIGFREVGFAPVTTSWQRDWAIEGSGYEQMLEQFDTLAYEFRDSIVAGRHHGFSNVRDTLQEIHKGMSKAYPCGAGFGLLGVATDGDVSLCHRFAGSPEHELGSVSKGLNRDMQQAFLDRHHVDNKTDCSVCWARPICAGGCYHEAHTRYGDTAEPNLHYCTWIRHWTDTCLRIYGELAERRPDYLEHLA